MMKYVIINHATTSKNTGFEQKSAVAQVDISLLQEADTSTKMFSVLTFVPLYSLQLFGLHLWHSEHHTQMQHVIVWINAEISSFFVWFVFC